MAASDVTEQMGVASVQVTRHYFVEKCYYDNAKNIEAVNIHYACTPMGEAPDWNSQRVTRFLPLVEAHLRRKVLKLPLRILTPNRSELTDRYLLHHYFQIFVDGDTHYSSLYTEEVVTGAGTLPASRDANSTPADETASGSEEDGATAGDRETGRAVPAAKTMRMLSKAKQANR
jgi:hypothetical protein